MQYVRKNLPIVVTNEYIKWSGGSLYLTSKKIESAPKNLIALNLFVQLTETLKITGC